MTLTIGARDDNLSTVTIIHASPSTRWMSSSIELLLGIPGSESDHSDARCALRGCGNRSQIDDY